MRTILLSSLDSIAANKLTTPLLRRSPVSESVPLRTEASLSAEEFRYMQTRAHLSAFSRADLSNGPVLGGRMPCGSTLSPIATRSFAFSDPMSGRSRAAGSRGMEVVCRPDGNAMSIPS